MRGALYILTYDMSDLHLWSSTQLCWIPPLKASALGVPVELRSRQRAGPCTVSIKLRMMQATVCRKRSALDFL